MATEVGLFPLKAGLDVHDKTNATYRLFIDALNTVVSQPGAKRAVYGMEVENPTNLRLYVEWEKVEDHIAFTQSAAYGPMLKELEPLFSSAPTLRHIAPQPFPSGPLSPNVSGALEIFTAYWPSDVSAADQKAYEKSFQEFADKCLSKSSGFKGVSSGWSIENDVPNVKQDGKPSKAFVGFIAWESLEAHQELHDNEPAFKENIHLLSDGPESLDMFHIKPEELVGGLA